MGARATPVLVAVSMLATGCLYSEAVVSARQVHRYVPELRAEGDAEIDGRDVSMSDDVVAGGRRTTIARLVDGCPDRRPYGPTLERASQSCALLRVEDVSFGEELDGGATATLWAGATLAVVAVGVLVGLLVALDSSDSHCDIDCP